MPEPVEHILSIETSTNVCSVAVHSSGRLLAVESLMIDRSHSRYLADCVAHLLDITGVHKKELAAVAISKGPGSYTGLRIGASAAKGLCYALDLPLIGVNTLEAMARAVMHFIPAGAVLCPMLDARRMEVYYLVMSQEGDMIEPTAAKIIDSGSFKDHLQKQPVYFFGNGASKCKQVLGQSTHALFIDDIFADAAGVGQLAWTYFERQQFEDLAYFEPYYLKDFMTREQRKNIVHTKG